MRRYAGERLPPGCSIAVVANDALGNFVVSTPLQQMMHAQLHPGRLDYYGGDRTKELEVNSALADSRFPLHTAPLEEAIAHAKERGGYDLIFNLEKSEQAVKFCGLAAGPETLIAGHFLTPSGEEPVFEGGQRVTMWADEEWISPQITERYKFLDSGFIGEIFCRLAFLDGPIPLYKVPQTPLTRELPEVLIATAASLDNKRWPVGKWTDLLQRIEGKGFKTGLIGAAPAAQGAHWKGAEDEEALLATGLLKDLRGHFSIPQVVGALAKAKVVLTIDNGILHLAVSTGVPVVGLYRHGIHRLWAPPYANLKVLTPGEGRQVAEIEAEAVWQAVADAL